MAAFHGKAGSVTFDSTGTADVINWTLNVTSDVAETTSMTDTYKSYLAGFKDWTATVEALLPTGGSEPTIADIGSTVKTLVLDTATGTAYTATTAALIVSFSITQDMNDIVKITYEFQGSGTISEA